MVIKFGISKARVLLERKSMSVLPYNMRLAACLNPKRNRICLLDKEKIMPNRAQIQGIQSVGQYGGGGLFTAGNAGMLIGGRRDIIAFRQAKNAKK